MQNDEVIRGGVDAIDETFLAGWLAAPEEAAPVGFDVYVDDRLIWFDREADEQRPDLAVDCNGLKPFGFLVSLPEDIAPGSAHVRLTARGTKQTLLETRLEKRGDPQGPPVRGAIDRIDGGTVAGWLAAPAGKGTARFDVYVDDRMIWADQEANEPRPAAGGGAPARGFVLSVPDEARHAGASLRITASGTKRVLLETSLQDRAGGAPSPSAHSPDRATPAKEAGPRRFEIARISPNQLAIRTIAALQIDPPIEARVFFDDVFFAKVALAPDATLSGEWRLSAPASILDAVDVVSLRAPDGSRCDQKLGAHIVRDARASFDPFPDLPGISVIVPIFNASEDLKICIRRLLEFTPAANRFILIDDASTDERVAGALQEARKHARVMVVENPENLGFTRTANLGIGLAGRDDVVLLNSDARVTPRWLEGLREAALLSSRVATVTPMSDRAGAFSAPEMGNDNPLPAGIDEAGFALEFRRSSKRFYPEVPTGNGFCLYIKRKILDEVGALDEEAFPRGYGEENDLCMRAQRAGWRHIVDDATYVFHERSRSFGEARLGLIAAGRHVVDARYPEYSQAIRTFSESPAMLGARFQARLARNAASRQGAGRERILFATSFPKTSQLDTLLDSLGDAFEPWILEAAPEELRLFRREKRGRGAVAAHCLAARLDPRTHVLLEYDQIVSAWLREHDFGVLHISTFVGHSLSLPQISKRFGAAVVASFDDYYTACPTATLRDENRIFCDGVCTGTPGDCAVDARLENALPTLKNAWVKNWRSLFDAALGGCDRFLASSDRIRQILVRLHPSIEADRFDVIAPGGNGRLPADGMPEDVADAADSQAAFLRFYRLALARARKSEVSEPF